MKRFIAKVEDSINQFQVIDLCAYDKVTIPNEIHPWASGGNFYEVRVEKNGKEEMFRIDVDIIEKYRECVRYNIDPDEYDVFKKIEKSKF